MNKIGKDENVKMAGIRQQTILSVRRNGIAYECCSQTWDRRTGPGSDSLVVKEGMSAQAPQERIAIF